MAKPKPEGGEAAPAGLSADAQPSQASSVESDEGDLSKLVAQVKTAAAKKVRGRKKELLKTIGTRVAAEENKYRAERSKHAKLIAQAEHEWSRSLAETKAAHEAVLGDLVTLETQLGDIQREIQHRFVEYAQARVHEGDQVRKRMRATAAGQQGNTSGAQGE